MTIQRAELSIDADADGDGTTETGTFVFNTNHTISPGVRTGYLVGPRGSRVHNIIADQTGDGEDRRQNFVLDLGGGVFKIDIEFTGYEGSTDQWGDSSTQGLSATHATGQAPISQASVLMKYLTAGEADSLTPATLAWGEYSSSGVYSAMDVAIEEPDVTVDYDDGDVSSFTGSLTCLSIADLSEAWDAQDRNSNPRGP